MIVVSNTSPIMNLAVVRQIHILERLYGKVYILEAVWQELSAIGTGQSWSAILPGLSWLETRSVSNRSQVDLLLLELERGEAEAICLAMEMKANHLLIDERRGRTVASHLGLKFIQAAVVAEHRNASTSKDGPMQLIGARVDIAPDLTGCHGIIGDDMVIILGKTFCSRSSCARLSIGARETSRVDGPSHRGECVHLLARQWSRRPIRDHRHSHHRHCRRTDRGSRATDTAIRDAGAQRGWHPLGC